MLTHIFGCDVRELLHAGKYTHVYRAQRRADGLPVVLKVLDEANPPPRRLSTLRHEYALLRDCAADNVVRTYGLEEEQGRFGIVMEDSGGVPLLASGLMGAVSIEQFVEMALELADILHGIHRRRVVHKDLNPSNLIVNPETRRLKLIDFSIATVLPDGEQGFASLNSLEGTLPYISPEQTGRMNRPIDERTDFYSLGVTLFELLTGRLPFIVMDPLEMVHCHLAHRPPSPRELNPAVPHAIADVLLKLMAKNADERYRSARGLRADLSRCLEQLRRGASLEPFVLGASDPSDRIYFPRRLFGRDAETKRLLEGFEQSTHGAVLMLVSGYAGIGKTALIQEVYRPLTERRGYFAAGKFDQFNNTPYNAFIQAFQSLIQHLLTESEARLEAWRQRILEALGPSCAVLADVCPQLRTIIGLQPTPAPLAPNEARNRVHEAVHQFVALFARPEHPLCLFIDDLQWADADTLKLLQELMHMARDQSLFLIGAYRDNEAGESHPLRATIQAIVAQGSTVEQLSLAPLELEDLSAMLGATLGAFPEEITPLAQVVLARTSGNPFFVRAFVTSLHQEGGLQRTPDGWRFDANAIHQSGVTLNVVDLLASRIKQLRGATQELLRLAACIGNRFDLGTLAVVAGRAVDECGRDLWDAAVEGLVLPLSRVHSSVEAASAGPDLRFRFAHDRIQQAALATLDEPSRVRLHLDVGRKLLKRFHSGEEQEQWLFETVGQLNRGREAISEQEELNGLADLNLRAARKALQSASTEPAFRYAMEGIALLSDLDWEGRYDLARELHYCGIEASFARADLEKVQSLSASLLRHARTPIEEARVRRIEGQVLYAQMRVTEAIDTFSELLARIGFPLPSPATPEAIAEQMRRTEEALAKHEIEELGDLPRCSDEAARAALEVLNRMVFLTMSVSHHLFAPVICQAVQISLKYGNTAESAFAYTYYGVLLTHSADFDRAARLGRTAIALSDRFGDNGIRALVYLYAHYQLIHWKLPLYETSQHYLDAYRYGMEAGNPFSASAAATSWCGSRLLAGEPLGQLVADMERYAEVATRFHQNIVKTWHDLLHQVACNLCEETPNPTHLAGPYYNEDERLPVDRAEGGAMANYHLCKMMLCYLFGDFERAAVHAREREPFAAVTATSFWGPILALWDSLTRLAIFERSGEEERGRLLQAVLANERKLEVALPHCPKTIAHKLVLVQARRAEIEGRDGEAREAFERAVGLARTCGYVQEEALVRELAGRFYLNRRDMRASRTHFREAHAAYLRWGAVPKAKALETELPHLIPRVVSLSPGAFSLSGTRTGEWDLNVLDLVSVLNASQALSREVERERLLTRLMALLLETGGAQMGALLRERDGKWFVEAEKSVGQEQPGLFEPIPIEGLGSRGYRGVPATVVHYVARTSEPLVLEDASTSPQFRRDPYIVRNQVSSVLCLPLPYQSGRMGILYLENNLMKGAFTPGRIKILQLLSTQAVISLDNAMLYRTLEQRVEERTRELQAKNEELTAAMNRLREAQDRLLVQERLASLGALTAGIAHELRNPLNFVNNFVSLSEELLGEMAAQLETSSANPPPTEQEEMRQRMSDLQVYMSRIQENGRRMNGIIISMLEHSRGDKGESQEVNLNALVEKYSQLAVHGLSASLPPSAISLELDLDPSIGNIWLVPQEMSRVILNLIENAGHAVKAKRKSQGDARYQPCIRISTRNEGDKVEFRVHDNGKGIPAGIRDRVFEPFFTTKPTGEGTGLGLSICHDIIVKGNRGSIHIESVEGEFTEFIVTLPRRQG